MRIIAGAYKGRRLKAPTWDGLRPTSDKLRETLFNVLALRVPDARVLDGFAGTGAVGLEALSRGAAQVTFIEKDRRAAALVRENLAAAGVDEGSYTIECSDIRLALRRMPADRRFDLIFLDPPYALDGIDEILAEAAGHLAPDGLLVLERATRREPDVPPSLVRVRDIRSGDSSLTLLRGATQDHAEPGTA